MPRTKITDLWREFLGPDYVNCRFADRVWANSFCGLCGNSGVIDTRGQVFTAAGQDCGVRRYCICPNGRDILKGNGGAQIRDQDLGVVTRAGEH